MSIEPGFLHIRPGEEEEEEEEEGWIQETSPLLV